MDAKFQNFEWNLSALIGTYQTELNNYNPNGASSYDFERSLLKHKIAIMSDLVNAASKTKTAMTIVDPNISTLMQDNYALKIEIKELQRKYENLLKVAEVNSRMIAELHEAFLGKASY